VKLLRATRETQGQRGNDFHWTHDDELLYPGMVCDKDRENPDGPCGCSRALTGLVSHKGTTTFAVVEEDYTRDQALQMFREGVVAAGWPADLAEVALDDVLDWTKAYDAGAILERRGASVFQARESVL
jgi:hypothetical protein